MGSVSTYCQCVCIKTFYIAIMYIVSVPPLILFYFLVRESRKFKDSFPLIYLFFKLNQCHSPNKYY